MNQSGISLNTISRLFGGICVFLTLWVPAFVQAQSSLRVGLAEVDITPPDGFPMAGYYHERLATGSLDPLKAKAIVWNDGQRRAALVACDLIGIATDLSREARKQASDKTGIPFGNIVISATHSHTAPDYMKELCLTLGNSPQKPERRAYMQSLIARLVGVITAADAKAVPSHLAAGYARQETPVAFNRRFVMRDGSVKTWQNHRNPDVVRAAGPIDPDIGLVVFRESESNRVNGIFSCFALHLDTVGGTRWSADYPHHLQQCLRESAGQEILSIFAAGCCGDINHADPNRPERNSAEFIGRSLGKTILERWEQLPEISEPRLHVGSRTVHLPLQQVTQAEVAQSVQLLKVARSGKKIDFFQHVKAYKTVILDQFLHASPFADSEAELTWGLSRSLAGTGSLLPVDVSVITIGTELAIVCLPGEVFVELGLAIKQASPFRTTLVVELSNAVETIYVPHRAAYAGGSYEVTNSAVQPGSGEMLVEAAIRELRVAASAAVDDRKER